jgi:chaperonin cofactor prefoldin
VCPKPDMDLTELQQRLEALEKQVTSLAHHLLRAELRLKEMEAERRGGWKKLSDP